MTRTAFDNAIASVATTGGSTNAVLHLMAIAHEAGVDAGARRLRSHQRADAAAGRPQAVGPLRRDRSHAAGGSRARRAAADRGRRGRRRRRRRSPGARSARKRPRRSRRRAGSRAAARAADQEERRPRDSARQPRARGRGDEGVGHRARWSIAGRRASSTARRRRSTPSSARRSRPATSSSSATKGPSGGPGMREMLGVTGAIVGAGLGDSVALVTDGRFSGATRGFWSATSRPKRSRGGPMAAVRDGDTIVIDVASAPPRRRDQRRGR